MDEIFSHLLTLTTYVSRRFICFIGEFFLEICISFLYESFSFWNQCLQILGVHTPYIWSICTTFRPCAVNADNLVRQEINKCTEDMLVVSSGQHPRSSGHSISEPNLEQHACSYVTCGAETRVRIGGREVFDVLVEVPVNTGSEIIESNYSYLGGPFVFQG